MHMLVGRRRPGQCAAARFGVMAIVVPPLLPEGPIGPLGGVRPRELWLLVLFFISQLRRLPLRRMAAAALPCRRTARRLDRPPT
jgi:hypothetical protein